jgi:hypothetical protein
MACMGVSFHDRQDVDSIASAAKRLLSELQPGEAILVEAFQETLTPRHARQIVDSSVCTSATGQHGATADVTARLAWSATELSSCRFRATVCRGADNKAHMTKVRRHVAELVIKYLLGHSHKVELYLLHNIELSATGCGGRQRFSYICYKNITCRTISFRKRTKAAFVNCPLNLALLKI